MSTYTPECDLLVPSQPAAHSDDWPIFNLSAVEIFDSHTTSLQPTDFEDLLIADVGRPLRIRGKLASLPSQLTRLRVRPGFGTELIELDDVRQFAYGQYEDGSVDLWAAGKAGWYALRPTRRYRQIFDNSVQAIETLYFLADTYRAEAEGTRSRKGKKRDTPQLSVEEAFAKYAATNSLQSEDDARAIFERHAPFLVRNMVKGKEGVAWNKTPIWAWMRDLNPNLFRQDEPASEGQAKPGRKRKRSVVYQPRVSTASSRRADSEDGTTRGRKSAKLSSAPGTPPLDDTDTASDVRRPRGQKGKSVLRPKQSKYIALDSPAIDDDAMVVSPTEPAPAAAAAASAPPPRRSLRDDPYAVSTLRAMKVSVGADMDEGIDMSLDQSDAEDDSDAGLMLNNDGTTMLSRWRKEDLVATHHGDTWCCPLDGCMHKIYAASAASSQGLIKEHYRMHVDDEDTERRLQLVRRMQGPGYSVNRLMGRIQQLAGQPGFPAPIARKF